MDGRGEARDELPGGTEGRQRGRTADEQPPEPQGSIGRETFEIYKHIHSTILDVDHRNDQTKIFERLPCIQAILYNKNAATLNCIHASIMSAH